MSTGSAAQPPHRRWLHALEDDYSIPAPVMQVARVFADFAAGAVNGKVKVSWRMLRRCTHQRNDRIGQSIGYLVEYGWLTEEPCENGEPRKNGQRKFYRLTAPARVSGF